MFRHGLLNGITPSSISQHFMHLHQMETCAYEAMCPHHQHSGSCEEAVQREKACCLAVANALGDTIDKGEELLKTLKTNRKDECEYAQDLHKDRRLDADTEHSSCEDSDFEDNLGRCRQIADEGKSRDDLDFVPVSRTDQESASTAMALG